VASLPPEEDETLALQMIPTAMIPWPDDDHDYMLSWSRNGALVLWDVSIDKPLEVVCLSKRISSQFRLPTNGVMVCPESDNQFIITWRQGLHLWRISWLTNSIEHVTVMAGIYTIKSVQLLSQTIACLHVDPSAGQGECIVILELPKFVPEQKSSGTFVKRMPVGSSTPNRGMHRIHISNNSAGNSKSVNFFVSWSSDPEFYLWDFQQFLSSDSQPSGPNKKELRRGQRAMAEYAGHSNAIDQVVLMDGKLSTRQEPQIIALSWVTLEGRILVWDLFAVEKLASVVFSSPPSALASSEVASNEINFYSSGSIASQKMKSSHQSDQIDYLHVDYDSSFSPSGSSSLVLGTERGTVCAIAVVSYDDLG
jgi:hypothetical protein